MKQIVFALAIASALASESAPLVKSGEKIAFLGDSITQFGDYATGYINLVMSGLEIGGVTGYAGCFDHCLIGVDPKLRGKGKWAYRPVTGSPCIDAGRKQDWMTGAIDLYGQPRVHGVGTVQKPDIGAAEYRPSGFSLWVK